MNDTKMIWTEGYLQLESLIRDLEQVVKDLNRRLEAVENLSLVNLSRDLGLEE